MTSYTENVSRSWRRHDYLVSEGHDDLFSTDNACFYNFIIFYGIKSGAYERQI